MQTKPVVLTTLVDDVYQVQVRLLAGIKLEHFEEAVKKFIGWNLELNESSLGAEAMIYSEGNKFLIWFNTNNPSIDDIAHEALHLVRRIFIYKDLLTDNEGLEHHAYYQGYWIRKIIEALKDIKKRGKKCRRK